MYELREITHGDLKIGNRLRRKRAIQPRVYEITYAVSRNPWGIPIPNSGRFRECDKILDDFTAA